MVGIRLPFREGKNKSWTRKLSCRDADGFGLASGRSYRDLGEPGDRHHRFRATWFWPDLAATRALGSELAVWLLSWSHRGPLLAAPRGELGGRPRPAWFRGWRRPGHRGSLSPSPSFGPRPALPSGRARAVFSPFVHLDLYRLAAAASPMSCSPRKRKKAQSLGACWRLEWPSALSQPPALGADGGTVSMERTAAMPDHAGGFSWGIAPAAVLQRELAAKRFLPAAALGLGLDRAADPAQIQGPAGALPKRMGLPQPIGMAVVSVFGSSEQALDSGRAICSRPAGRRSAGAGVSTTFPA